MKNHYNVLELEKNCTAEEIKDSYIKLSKKYHPDRNKSKEAEKKILEINEAYSVLKNKSARNRYDESLRWNDFRQQQKPENVRQNTGGYSYNRFHYDDYVHYYRKVNNQGYAEPHSRKFTVVLCCCVLMVFGAGLRIMYAWSEAYHRKRLNEMMTEQMLQKQHFVHPKVEKMQLLLKRKHEKKMKEKESEP